MEPADFAKALNPVDEAYTNAILYGLGVIAIQFDGTSLVARTVPRSEYEQLGEHLSNFPSSIDIPEETE
jgi:hypothetical protein